jgi:prolipoprotein diacylglyceryltransferase
MTHAFKHSLEPFRGIDLGFFINRFYSLMFVIAFGLGWYIMKTSLNARVNLLRKLDSLFCMDSSGTLLEHV